MGGGTDKASFSYFHYYPFLLKNRSLQMKSAFNPINHLNVFGFLFRLKISVFENVFLMREIFILV